MDAQDTLGFSRLSGVRAMIETMPLARAAQAYARMMRGDARFRMVRSYHGSPTHHIKLHVPFSNQLSSNFLVGAAHPPSVAPRRTRLPRALRRSG
jgi:hypothetical protein